MSALDINAIVEAFDAVIPEDKRPAALHEPFFSGNEWVYVKECLDSTWVSYVGKYVDMFEKMLSEFTGVRLSIAVVNGTAALHMCMKLMGVKHGDEVLVPTLTFVATANAVSYCGAIPHFIDSEERTLGVDPEKLHSYLRKNAKIRKDGCYNHLTGRRIKAVVPVHVFGHPVDMEHLVDVCHEFRIALIEDAAESIGSYYKNRHTGHWGDIAALSFNGNKTITTGGGGAILTNNDEIGRQARHLTTTARIQHRWIIEHDVIGYNYRLPGLNAALGCAQMEQLPTFLERKRSLAKKYKRAFEGIEGVTFFTEPRFAKTNYWLNALLLDEKYSVYRDALLEATNNQGIMTRPAWELMHRLPMYHDCPCMDVSVSERLARRIINIPSSVSLGESYV